MKLLGALKRDSRATVAPFVLAIATLGFAALGATCAVAATAPRLATGAYAPSPLAMRAIPGPSLSADRLEPFSVGPRQDDGPDEPPSRFATFVANGALIGGGVGFVATVIATRHNADQGLGEIFATPLLWVLGGAAGAVAGGVIGGIVAVASD